MTSQSDKEISDRLNALEAKVDAKPKRSFPTTTVLALLPIAFGLYQFHLSNQFKKEETQTRALLGALEGETPSDICGNLSLLVEGKLVTEERLEATQDLIDEITQRDRQQLDGGVGEFDCLPRIIAQTSDVSSLQRVSGGDPSLEELILEGSFEGPAECFNQAVELRVAEQHAQSTIDEIADYLDEDGVLFAEVPVEASDWELNNYSGLIWYYSIGARSCAKSISEGLATLGIDLEPRYYTRDNLPSSLPIRVWPNI